MIKSSNLIVPLILVGLLSLLCLNANRILAEQPPSARLSQELVLLAKKNPELVDELKQLAAEVPASRTVMEAHMAEGGTAEMLATLWKWGDILVTAFDSVKQDFDAFKKKWPQVVKHGRLFCAIADEDGKKHLITSVFNEPGQSGVSLMPIQTYGLKGEDAAIYIEEDNEPDAWTIEVVKGRELLVLVQRFAGNAESKLQAVRVQKLQVTKDSRIEVVSDKTESVRWNPPRPEDKEKGSQSPMLDGSSIKQGSKN